MHARRVVRDALEGERAIRLNFGRICICVFDCRAIAVDLGKLELELPIGDVEVLAFVFAVNETLRAVDDRLARERFEDVAERRYGGKVEVRREVGFVLAPLEIEDLQGVGGIRSLPFFLGLAQQRVQISCCRSALYQVGVIRDLACGEINHPAVRVVDAAQIEHELAVDEHPDVVVAGKREDHLVAICEFPVFGHIEGGDGFKSEVGIGGFARRRAERHKASRVDLHGPRLEDRRTAVVKVSELLGAIEAVLARFVVVVVKPCDAQSRVVRVLLLEQVTQALAGVKHGIAVLAELAFHYALVQSAVFASPFVEGIAGVVVGAVVELQAVIHVDAAISARRERVGSVVVQVRDDGVVAVDHGEIELAIGGVLIRHGDGHGAAGCLIVRNAGNAVVLFPNRVLVNTGLGIGDAVEPDEPVCIVFLGLQDLAVFVNQLEFELISLQRGTREHLVCLQSEHGVAHRRLREGNDLIGRVQVRRGVGQQRGIALAAVFVVPPVGAV